MEIRERAPEDMTALEALARVVHTTDGYPSYLPRDDVRRFLERPRPLGAWVAVDDGAITGHVALNASSSEAVMRVASEAGIDARTVGVVARLLVSPAVRRRGVGRRLLARATEAAAARGLVPILDVVASFAPAIALYERAGWVCLGAARFELPDGGTVDEVVYRAPS
jgi:GNAT superfamily N-acetyltransferase